MFTNLEAQSLGAPHILKAWAPYWWLRTTRSRPFLTQKSCQDLPSKLESNVTQLFNAILTMFSIHFFHFCSAKSKVLDVFSEVLAAVTRHVCETLQCRRHGMIPQLKHVRTCWNMLKPASQRTRGNCNRPISQIHSLRLGSLGHVRLLISTYLNTTHDTWTHDTWCHAISDDIRYSTGGGAYFYRYTMIHWYTDFVYV